VPVCVARAITYAGVDLRVATNLLVATCEAGVDNEDGPSTRVRIVRFAQLGGGRHTTGDPRPTIASLVPDAIDLAMGLATVRSFAISRLCRLATTSDTRAPDP
jgi:hypothetical protein